MNDTSVLIAVISLLGTVTGSITGVLVSNKLTTYRIEQLEKKLDKYATNVDEIKEWRIKTELSVKALHERFDDLVVQLGIAENREDR